MNKYTYVDQLTWERLQESLKQADETVCKQMLLYEMKNQKRLQFMLRMHSRFNKLRAAREREQIGNGTFR